MNINFQTPTKFVKGIGEKRASLLHRLDIYTVSDLLSHYPRAYETRGIITKVANLSGSEIPYNLMLTVSDTPKETRTSNGRKIITFSAYDDTGFVHVVFFNQIYLKTVFVVGAEYRFRGKVIFARGEKTLYSPSYEKAGADLSDIVPIYHLTEGIFQSTISCAIKNVLSAVTFEDYLPDSIKKENNLCELDFAMRNIHFPENENTLEEAKRRLCFDEFFLFSLALMSIKKDVKIPCIEKMAIPDTMLLYNKLPYELTNAQKRAISDIENDISGVKYPDRNYIPHMRRLIQGDVGSGKTIVAAAAVFIVIRNGGRAVMMVPTEILANQHYNDITPLFASLGIKVALLTGSTTESERKKLFHSLENETADTPMFIIGTHALLENYVEIPKLSLIITDEQHRFGVHQREKLSQKNLAAHTLIMSATPIPRTLAIFLFGDLDISIIDELPPSRQKVDTFLVGEEMRERINIFIEKQISYGRQVYIICPLIEDEDDESDLKNATDYFNDLSKDIFPHLRIALLHGKMKSAQKDKIMTDFAAGEFDILVSTTVIEVGVNVPNASLIVVENAERFGLSQLHQLRGRVGRGNHKSYCVLFSKNKSERLKILAKTNDGFEIARYDLENRGPGDFFGLRQHGELNFKLAAISDMQTLANIKNQADSLLMRDPMLSLPENKMLSKHVDKVLYSTTNLST